MSAFAGAGPRSGTVLHVDTERGWRGGERQVLWLAVALHAMGWRSLIAARPNEPLFRNARQEGIPVVGCAPLAELDPLAAVRLRWLVRKESVDIVHAHTAHAVSLAALATLRTPAATVVTRRVDFRLRGNPVSRWKYARASAIVAISNAVADALVASGMPRQRIEVIPSGIDLTRQFVPANSETLAVLGVPVGAPLVVQVSQLVPHKDPLTFVRAIAAARRRVPELHALLVGDGPLRGVVEDEIRALDLREALHLTGYRRDADSLLAAAQVVTLSSQEEGLGTVLLDAISMGKPVAATRGGGIPEIIQHGTSGLLAPVHDGESLGEEIAILLTDPELAARVARGARTRANDFSVENTAARTAEVYERVRRS